MNQRVLTSRGYASRKIEIGYLEVSVSERTNIRHLGLTGLSPKCRQYVAATTNGTYYIDLDNFPR